MDWQQMSPDCGRGEVRNSKSQEGKGGWAKVVSHLRVGELATDVS